VGAGGGGLPSPYEGEGPGVRSTEAQGASFEAWEVLDLLSQLVDKSLVLYEQGEPARYSLLETIRQYSRERLAQAGEAERIGARYAEHFLCLAREMAPQFKEPNQLESLNLVAADLDNLRAALDWLLAHQQIEKAAEMSVALAGFWERRSSFQEGLDTLKRCLAHEDQIDDACCCARLLGRAGWFAYRTAAYEEAGALQQRGLALCRELADTEEEAYALNDLASTAQAQGRLEEARELFEQSLALARRLGDQDKVAVRLSNLGRLTVETGQLEEARRYLGEALTIFKGIGDIHSTSACLCNLSDLALRQGDWLEAEGYSEQSLALFRELGDEFGVACALANLAEAALQQGDEATAERQIREALFICRKIGQDELIATLLEIYARALDARSACEEGLFALLAAENLRADLGLPRSYGQQHELEAIRGRLVAAVGDETAAILQAEMSLLRKEDILARVVKQ